jgi:hypothetical protein
MGVYVFSFAYLVNEKILKSYYLSIRIMHKWFPSQYPVTKSVTTNVVQNIHLADTTSIGINKKKNAKKMFVGNSNDRSSTAIMDANRNTAISKASTNKTPASYNSTSAIYNTINTARYRVLSR